MSFLIVLVQSGIVPLEIAVDSGHIETVQRLLETGVPVDYQCRVSDGIINPRRACTARVTVVGLSLCVWYGLRRERRGRVVGNEV